MRIGVADHLGWAVVVTANDDHEVVDRRRVTLVDDGLPAAPVHHEGGAHELHRTGPPLDDAALAELVDVVRTSAMACARAAFAELVADLGPDRALTVRSVSVRSWPDDFPTDIATVRRVPYESRADPIMYRSVIAELSVDLGWEVHRYEARTVEADAAARVGARADEVLHGPRRRLGAPWAKDHRMALAATICAG